MSNFLATLQDCLPLIIGGAAVVAAAWAVDRLAGRYICRVVDDALADLDDDDADWIADATIERLRRDQRSEQIAREVRDAFLDTMHQHRATVETPIFNAMRMDRFEADALAEIEELTGGDVP